MAHRYITTTLPYVNADPHIGFALELVQADVIARTWRLQNHDVIFNTGTDEHGQKIFQKAQEQGKNPQEYCDEYAAKFDTLKSALNVSYTHFIRTTNTNHKKAAQEFWRRCEKNGDIYKKNYETKYCVGCELEKTDSDLIDGNCPIHPNTKIELRNEENYFFRFSKYQSALLNLYSKQASFVIPSFRLNEIIQFVSAGLHDFSISRLKSKMPWGVDVPHDPNHVMYVWFDALINYISTLGWPDNQRVFSSYWPGIQIAGKDNLRQQSAMWQAMLIAAGIAPSQKIVIHGFVTSNGQKMSKSIGNVVNPFELVRMFGTDAVRYYLLKEIPTLDDGDFSLERMKQLYESDLSNELGNCLLRITTLAESDKIRVVHQTAPNKILEADWNSIEHFQINTVLQNIGEQIKHLNKTINDFQPWKKKPTERREFLEQSLSTIYTVGSRLQPLLPDTAQSIIQFTSGTIKKAPVLFPRLQK